MIEMSEAFKEEMRNRAIELHRATCPGEDHSSLCQVVKIAIADIAGMAIDEGVRIGMQRRIADEISEMLEGK